MMKLRVIESYYGRVSGKHEYLIMNEHSNIIHKTDNRMSAQKYIDNYKRTHDKKRHDND